ncbi:MAG TPA: ATP-dependent 6-phosphofructokinase, partial [Nitrospiria bacterium]|nr:ATP-dependent 6-phosphofructokinase [Nitrospiria bacterium]
AVTALQARGIDAVVIIGGDGSQAGAYDLSQMGVPVVGVASTIDNDLVGSEITIGVDTALNIALEAIDRLKTTASSHQRAFLVEVMGRDCGYLTLMAGIAGGAEVIAIPEAPCDPEIIAQELRAAYDRGKSHAIAVIAEGAKYKAPEIAAYFKEHHQRIGFELRVTLLGHVQRGGAPGAFDRLLATRLGAGAVDALVRGQSGVLVGLLNGRVSTTPLAEVAHVKKPLDLSLLELARVLAR